MWLKIDDKYFMKHILEFESFNEKLEIKYVGINDLDNTFEIYVNGKLYSYKSRVGGYSIAYIDRYIPNKIKSNPAGALTWLKNNTDLKK